ncbi:thioesterase family protein [Leucobacter albus]|uniref:Thioesterase family protein n=1 Tax=Leucobacter albus TaxID=272210 RepID=A0ABW3TJ52_9MICO
MHMLPRTLWHRWFVGSRGPRLDFSAVSRSHFRVWPTDLDILRHMNNGKYLSLMDIGRFDLMQRNGVLELLARESWYPVVVGQTISYRKSLNPWMKFTIESRVLGFDAQAVYMEQRFVRPAPAGSGIAGSPEVYARAIVRARILRRAGGVVPVEEIIAKSGADPQALQVPAEYLEWGETTKLPSTRADAPSVWAEALR